MSFLTGAPPPKKNPGSVPEVGGGTFLSTEWGGGGGLKEGTVFFLAGIREEHNLHQKL